MEKDVVKDWLVAVLSGVVAYPESIEVSRVDDEMGVLYSIKVHASDRGKVIGREGAHAKALRTLLRSAGMKFDMRASLKVDVPDRNFRLSDEDRA